MVQNTILRHLYFQNSRIFLLAKSLRPPFLLEKKSSLPPPYFYWKKYSTPFSFRNMSPPPYFFQKKTQLLAPLFISSKTTWLNIDNSSKWLFLWKWASSKKFFAPLIFVVIKSSPPNLFSKIGLCLIENNFLPP